MIVAPLLAVAVLMAVSGLRTLLDAHRLRRLQREADAFHSAMRDF